MSKREDCFVCSQSAWKYKCPVCLVKYCSVTCYKLHKEQANCVKKAPEEHVTSVTSESKDIEPTCNYETEDTVPPKKLAQLGCNPFILNCLRNHHLRDILIHLNSLEDPYCAIADAMREPIFEEYAAKCLEVVGDHTDVVEQCS